MLEIRRMEIDDIADVVRIERENFSIPWDENGFFSFLIREGTVFLCALNDGVIIGYGGMVTAADEADITNVSVAKAYRRNGAARAIVKELAASAHEMGVKQIFLEVRSSNTAAISLYEKAGFERFGCRKGYYEMPKEDALIMRRKL